MSLVINGFPSRYSVKVDLYYRIAREPAPSRRPETPPWARRRPAAEQDPEDAHADDDSAPFLSPCSQAPQPAPF